jgi:predicted metalloprotease with PDZ domain
MLISWNVAPSIKNRTYRLTGLASTAILLWLFSLAAFAGAESHPSHITSITFRFRPVEVAEKRAFHVEVAFRPVEPITAIEIPTYWGSAQHLEGQTQNLRALTPGVKLDDTADPGEKKLYARPENLVTLAYDIVPMQTEWFSHPQEHMAIINADYFLFNLENALVHPKIGSAELVNATFDWRAMPKGMPLLTSFGVNDRVIRVRSPWFKVMEGLFAGGDFRVTQDTQNGARFVLAVRGRWKFSDAEAFAQIRRILDEENKFWRMQPMPFFLVTLAPFDDKSGQNDGSGFTNAFMLFLSHEDTFDKDRLMLVTHEMFHHWNPLSMGPIPQNDGAEWFTEGFTMYYEGAIPLRAGLISYQNYLDFLNRNLRQYQLSPMRNMSNAAWDKLSHASGPAYELPYARGASIALWADTMIRKRSGQNSSLDNVMFDLVREAQLPNPPQLNKDRLFSAFGRYLSPEQMGQLRAMVDDGANVPLPAALGNCATLKSVSQAVVDPGFDEKSLETKRIAGVDPAGPAYRAGIRDGQEVFRYSIYHEDPTKDVLLGVIVDGEKKLIRYSAAKQRNIEQYQQTAPESTVRACSPF